MAVPESKIETRAIPADEIRVHEGDDGVRIEGYAAVFHKLSEPLGFGEFRERIVPGAFAKSLASKRDVLALVDHDFGKVLGRRSKGTLKVDEDRKGLLTEIDPPDTTFARDAIEGIKRGDINGMSFRFNTLDDHWERAKDGTMVRELREVELVEVTVTAIPAYPDTKVAMRSLEQWRESNEQVPTDTLRLALELEAAR